MTVVRCILYVKMSLRGQNVVEGGFCCFQREEVHSFREHCDNNRQSKLSNINVSQINWTFCFTHTEFYASSTVKNKTNIDM
jgi:hypothetical protein